MASMSGASQLLRKRDVASLQRQGLEESALERSLGLPQLTAIGVGGIIGVGIFILTGTVAANEAGPGVSLSFFVVVVIKVAIIVLVIGVGVFYVDPGNLSPFLPFGFGGVVSGAALVFFAVFGAEVLSTAAEEARNPQRDLPRALLLSLAIVLVLYFGVSLVLTGMVPFDTLGNDAPVAEAFRAVGLPLMAAIVSVAVFFAVTAVLAFMLQVSRVSFAMSRDGLLPQWFAATHSRFRTPHRATLVIGVVAALAAGFLPLEQLAELVNIGILTAYVIVSAPVLILRYRSPEIERPFRAPLLPLVSLVGVVSCLILIFSLPGATMVRFSIWMGVGIVIYLLYGRRKSLLARGEDGPAPA